MASVFTGIFGIVLWNLGPGDRQERRGWKQVLWGCPGKVLQSTSDVRGGWRWIVNCLKYLLEVHRREKVVMF